MYAQSQYSRTKFAQSMGSQGDNTPPVVVTDSDTILTTKSGGYFKIKPSKSLIIEDPSNNKYRVAVYYTYTIDDTVEKIRKFKKFLNYYYNEPIRITNNTGIYEAWLDFSEHTRTSLNMFRDDTQITLNFYAIKVN